jgi:hypothetical protein
MSLMFIHVDIHLLAPSTTVPVSYRGFGASEARRGEREARERRGGGGERVDCRFSARSTGPAFTFLL